MSELQELKNFACELAKLSEPVIREGQLGRAFRVEEKADRTPVTEIDRKAEEIMRQAIERRYPGHAILGEEYGDKKLSGSAYTWIIDPIDGTKSFVAGVPLFGTLLALLREGEPILGVINLPMQQELYLGDSKTATLNGRPIKAAETASLEEALLLTTDLKDVIRLQDKERFETLMARTRLFRTWGDCFGYTLVARGEKAIMADPEMSPWDLLPLIPIIRGAGGEITGWHGENPVGAKDTLAAPKKLHALALEILQ